MTSPENILQCSSLLVVPPSPSISYCSPLCSVSFPSCLTPTLLQSCSVPPPFLQQTWNSYYHITSCKLRLPIVWKYDLILLLCRLVYVNLFATVCLVDDHSRVVLDDHPVESTLGYINGNYIDVSVQFFPVIFHIHLDSCVSNLCQCLFFGLVIYLMFCFLNRLFHEKNWQ